jgi:hypothetical protein
MEVERLKTELERLQKLGLELADQFGADQNGSPP